MIFKPFKGGLATVDYQMRNPTAKVLIGNPRQTSRLIRESKFAQPYCGMTLSFQERISPEAEAKIVGEFVTLILGGLEPDSLDILVVRHSDKKDKKTGKIRYDYHITTLETELRTGKHISVYHYIKDHDIFYAWEKKVNIQHGFSRPDDPARQSTTLNRMLLLPLGQQATGYFPAGCHWEPTQANQAVGQDAFRQMIAEELSQIFLK